MPSVMRLPQQDAVVRRLPLATGCGKRMVGKGGISGSEGDVFGGSPLECYRISYLQIKTHQQTHRRAEHPRRSFQKRNCFGMEEIKKAISWLARRSDATVVSYSLNMNSLVCIFCTPGGVARRSPLGRIRPVGLMGWDTLGYFLYLVLEI